MRKLPKPKRGDKEVANKDLLLNSHFTPKGLRWKHHSLLPSISAAPSPVCSFYISPFYFAFAHLENWHLLFKRCVAPHASAISWIYLRPWSGLLDSHAGILRPLTRIRSVRLWSEYEWQSQVNFPQIIKQMNWISFSKCCMSTTSNSCVWNIV